MIRIFIAFEFGKYLQLNLQNAHNSHLTSIYMHYNLSKQYAKIPFEVTIT